MTYLKDSSPRVRAAAAEALGLIGDEAASPKLEEALSDSAHTVRAAAAYAMGMLGYQPARPALLKLLQDEDSLVRRAAIQAIQALGAAPNLQALAKLTHDPDPEVRETLVSALASIQSQEAAAAVAKFLGDHVWRVRQAARDAMVRMGPVALPPLRDAAADSYWLVRALAAEALGLMHPDPQDTQLLVRLTKDESSHVRYAAVSALAKVGAHLPTEEASRLLADKDSFVREAAARACGTVCGPDAAPDLTRLLSDPSSQVRMWAATSLGRLGAAGAANALSKAAQDPEPYVREAAVEALGHLALPATLPALSRAAGDKDSMVRRQAARSLARLGQVALPTLKRLILRGTPRVRETAMWALAEISTPEAAQLALRGLTDTDWSVAASAARALEHQGRTALEPLLRALESGPAALQAKAARVLGRIARKHLAGPDAQSVYEKLKSRLSSADSQIKIACIRALGEMACDPCIRDLEGLQDAQDPRVRDAARASLAQAKLLRATPHTHPAPRPVRTGSYPPPGPRAVGGGAPRPAPRQ